MCGSIGVQVQTHVHSWRLKEDMACPVLLLTIFVHETRSLSKPELAGGQLTLPVSTPHNAGVSSACGHALLSFSFSF